MPSPMARWASLAAAGGLAAALALTGCGPKSTAGAGKASAAASSIAADPTTSADIAQAKADVKRCITGTPLEQIHTLHVLFLESASGSNGAEVTATRAKVFGCLGVPPAQQTAFKNDALTAAEHGKVYTRAGAKTYVEATLPALLLKYQQGGASPAASSTPTTTAAPAVSSVSAKAS
jgi:hypothetical protein